MVISLNGALIIEYGPCWSYDASAGRGHQLFDNVR